jgi:ACS family sodium-dependent inorganic phosphate cotransporter-like MFS transporter 6/7/8
MQSTFIVFIAIQKLIEFLSTFCRFKREQFSIPKPGGYAQMGGTDGGGGMYDDNVPDSPMSFEEIERPPLRHIDKYIKAEMPCLSQRYTIALMACLGFIISFGMRCNMGMAKLQLEHTVS